MVYKFSSLDTKQVATISIDPVGFMIVGTIKVSGGEFLNTEVVWRAALPIDADLDAENVEIKTINFESDVVSDLDEQLNAIDDFELIKHDLCRQAAKDTDYSNLKWLNEIIKSEEFSTSFTTNPYPDKHGKNDLFIQQKYQTSAISLSLFWRYNFHLPGISLTKVSSLSPLFEYSNKERFVDAAEHLAVKPSVPAEKTDQTNMLECLGNLEHSLTLGHQIKIKSTINYSDAGKKCLIEQKIKAYGRRFSMIWSAHNVKGVQWNSFLKGFQYEYRDDDFKVVPYELLKDSIEESHLVYQYGQNQVIEAILENHSGNRDEIVGTTIKKIFNPDRELKHAMAISSDDFDLDELTRSYTVSHTISTDESGFLRIYWRAKGDATKGFLSWDDAEFEIHSIKISGIKFTFFKGTEQYDELLSLLPKSLNLEKSSLIQVKDYINRKTEPLKEVFKLIS